jgi:serine/threonine-protein kinase
VGAPELAIGHVVDGKYEVRGLLHHGGSVATYRAVKAPDLPVAVKLFDPRLESFPNVVQALARCEALTRDIPGELVVHIVDMGKDPATGALYTVTPLDTDPPLGEVVPWSPLSASEMVAFVQSLARALDAVHARGIAHLSLKPTNVFVGAGPAYKVRLVDFAMTLVHGALPSLEQRRSSLPWLAPEQSGDAAEAGPAADVFATALLAFYALTAESYWHPFERESFDESAWQLEMFGSRMPASARARELSVSLHGAFDAAFARALAVSPEDRFRSAGQFSEALVAALEASGSVPTRRAILSANAPPIAGAAIPDVEGGAPTSTSAVILAPSLSPDAARPSFGSEATVAADVPPPPAQMGAVLAAFESETRSRTTQAPSIGGVPVGAPARSESRVRLLSFAAIVAGALVAGVIVLAIALKEGPTAEEQTPKAESSAASAPSETPAAPADAVPTDPVAPSGGPTAAAEPRTRAPGGKPSSKTVRSPRKPCGKSLKPCK